MPDHELTELLIELERIQTERFQTKARGQQAADLLAYYNIPETLYLLKQEPANGRPENRRRRKVAVFNFGLVTEDIQDNFIECLFMIGYTPDFISDCLGEDVKTIAQALISVVYETRTQKATELRKNPQRFRLVVSNKKT